MPHIHPSPVPTALTLERHPPGAGVPSTQPMGFCISRSENMTARRKYFHDAWSGVSSRRLAPWLT
eukprot:5730870-Prymnesium_polylepis.1